jgi:dipeptidase E
MRQIIAMGGGGFSMEPDNLALDRYILAQTSKADPAVCFLPTASGDADGYIVKFYAAFTGLACRPTHLSLFGRTPPDLGAFLLAQDVVYVGGGNTRSMLALWREWGLDDALRAAWDQGVILAGLSAGAICWFEEGVTDSAAGSLGPLAGLGLLAGSCCPHYDGEPERRPAYQRLVAGGAMLPGYGIDDGAALHFLDNELRAVVASRPESRAYRVVSAVDGVQEQALDVVYLQ